MLEFDLISKYFTWDSKNKSVLLSVGDDCAVLEIAKDFQFATSIDTLIAGVHFSDNTSAKDIAYKALAVNLSDLAAMGALPKFYTLAITMPDINSKWLADFSSSLREISAEFNIDLVGGDTTKGALSITISIFGWVEKGMALTRSGAKIGDDIYVSNTIGDAAFALSFLNNIRKKPIDRLNRPTPRVGLGRNLLGIASSCIDISDGLEQDLSHILKSSKVGAIINLEKIPLSKCVKDYVYSNNDWSLVINGGDDYELCFTVPSDKKDLIKDIVSTCDINISKIGVINADEKLTIIGNTTNIGKSYQHF